MIDASLLESALAEARRRGADYAEARAETLTERGVRARNGVVQRLTARTDRGWGLHVAAGSGWGFASAAGDDPANVAAVAQEAVDIARASATRHPTPIDLRAMPAGQGTYTTPLRRDPLAVPIEEQIALILEANNALQAGHPRVKVGVAFSDVVALDKLFVNTAG